MKQAALCDQVGNPGRRKRGQAGGGSGDRRPGRFGDSRAAEQLGKLRTRRPTRHRLAAGPRGAGLISRDASVLAGVGGLPAPSAEG